MKIYSISLDIRDMKLKTVGYYHISYLRMATVKQNTKMTVQIFGEDLN